MTDTATRLAGLPTEDLLGLHERLDRQGVTDPATVEAHHLAAIEMLRRDIPHGHTDDDWSRAVIVKESVIVDGPDDIDAPEGFEKAWGESLRDGGTISVLLTVDGYVLKADPTVSDVHVDTIMGGGKRRKPKAPIFDMAKTIREEDGKFTVYSEDGERKFGTYATREEAENRLRQIERFSKAEGYSVPSEVQAAAKRAVAWISDGKAGDGFTSVGRNRAKQLADGGVVSRATLVKMRAYFARHGKQRGGHGRLQDGEPTPWRVAWDAWGGDAGRAWVNRVLGAVEKRAIPEAITDLHLNLENRQHAIDEYLYGPMNPEEPGDYWERLGDVWGVSADEASSTRCGNCAAFNVKPEIKAAIADAISEEGDEVVDLADLGYCELLQFKCAGSRSCSVWLTGGPIGGEDEADEDEIELLESMDAEDLAEFASYAYLADEIDDDEFEKRGNPEALRDYWRGGGKGKISWGAGGDFTACVAAVGKYMTSEQAKGYCAIRHREVTGMWPGDKRNRTKKALEGTREAVAKFTLPGGATYEFTVPVEPYEAAELLAKHGSHNQKTHAGKGGGDLDPDVASSIIERTRANGGLSVNMVDGSEPPGGFMVARTKGVKPAIVDADEFYDPERGPAALGSFLKSNKEQLTGGDYLGVWHDTNSGKVFLDVSQNVKDQATAERLGAERDQISIWDVVNMKEIPTGGTGEIAKADSVDQVARSVEDDGRGDRRLRGGDLAEVQPEVSKHLQGKHDQKSHARGGRQQLRRKEIIAKGDTDRPLRRDADGRVINPEATGGYKAGIPETVVFKGETLTPEHSLWHHLEGNPKDGYTITAERAAVHRKIVEDATRGVPRSDDPTFHMLGGGPAAGKTTAVESGLANVPDKSNAVHINADDIKGALPEYDRMRFSSSDDDFFNAAAFSHEESSYLAKQVQKGAFANKQDVVLDGTGDSKYSTLEKKVGQAREAGYKVKATYATVPTNEAVRRSNERAVEPEERRFVPNDVVRGTHRDVSAVFPEATRRGLFDEAVLIDTTERGNAVLIGETSGGRFVVRDQQRWNDFVAKGSE